MTMRLRWIVTAYFILAMGVMAAVAAAPSGPFVLVVTNPASGASGNMTVVAEAGGSFVGSGTYPWLSTAYSDASDFPQRLRRAGALLVINHDLALGCLQDLNT